MASLVSSKYISLGKRELLKRPVLAMGSLFAFTLPIQINLATWAMWFWAAALVSTRTFQWNQQAKRIVLPFVLVYSTYVLGSLDDFVNSLPFLGRRLSFLLVAILIASSGFRQREIRVLLKAFIRGVLMAGIICLTVALIRSLHLSGEGLNFRPNVLEGRGFLESIIYGGNYFFGVHFSFLHQTAYFGLYVLAALSHLLFDKDMGINGLKKKWLIGFFIFLLILISNKGVFLGLGVLLIGFFAFRLPLKLFLISLVFLAGATYTLISWNPRLNQAVMDFKNKGFELNPKAQYGFYTRLLSWDSALELINEEAVTGYGVSRSQKELNKVYEQKGYVHPAKQQLNAHNLWFQLFLDNGIFGLFAALSVFYVLFRACLSINRYSQAFFWCVLILFLQTFLESIWNRFSGASFSAFYGSIVLATYFIQKQEG